MANKYLRTIPTPFQVLWNDQTVEVTHEKCFMSGGYGEGMHVQWTRGFINGLGEFVKVVVRTEPNTLVRGYMLTAAEMAAMMDANNNLKLSDIIEAADLKPPKYFNIVKKPV